ncbi:MULTISPECIES: HEAT repeat domain-containing protein [Nostoc]|uniref:HEAT repeat domain-containing protein n=2 Tax=Nostoc TaxID=1177 RepID=A0ABR8I3B5_9NOSO|nr:MULTISPECIES: HEAT repeat domain-containing protein [Nostoc]MBD2565620.1 HEAT repeat domain-containing protein [Nostoc linckia FACHB-391]MBD2646042.1 HEAT repeat domain-containing protein [Nostoc foliaceum FACHB-393]
MTFGNDKQPSVLLAILEIAIMTTLPIMFVPSTTQATHTRLSEVDHAEVTILMASAQINKQACSSLKISQTIERLQSQIVEPTQILLECGTAATVPLIQLLEDESKNTLSRRAAARVLSQIGSQEAIAALIRLVQQNRSDIRDSALRAIADINPQARDAVPILTVAVADKNLEVSKVGMEALRRIDPAVPNQVISFLQEALRSNNAQRRSTVRSLLDQLSSNSQPDISLLTQALESQHEPTRAIAAYVLVQLGNKAQVAIPVLTAALFDESSSVRDTAACALGRIGSREAITVLITQLKTGNEATQTSAAIGLSSLTAEAREALPVLIAALRDDNEKVRSMAAYALGQMEKHARRAIPALLGVLSDRNPSIRGSAIHALGQIAPDDPRVIRAIVRQSSLESDLTVLNNAAETLRQITPAAMPTLLEIIAFDKSWQNVMIADTLVGRFNPTILPSLTSEASLLLIPAVLRRYSELLYPYNYYTKGLVTSSSYFKRQLTPQVISQLVEILKDGNQDIRLRGNASMAIGLADLESPLIKILEDENQDIALRTDAVIALGFTSGSSVAISSLIKFVRQHPAYHLGLRLSKEQLREYLFSKLSNDELNLLGFTFITLLKFHTSNEANLFFNQFEQENSVLFSELKNLISLVNGADGPAMVRLLQETSPTPAICRITFMQRFLWRCRKPLKIS